VEIIVATDKLTIDTPEQVHLEFTLANIGSRFMAVLLDTIIQVLVYLALFLILTVVLQVNLAISSNYSVWILAIYILINFCIYVGYYAVFEVLWRGQTPGKRWAGIRVIKDSGRPINGFEAITRNAIRIIDQIPGIYAIGIVTMLLNSKNKRLGDFVAGTLVVHEKRVKESELFFNTSETKTDATLYQAGKLGIQEIELIETFLSRRLDIPPEVRRQNGVRIAEMIGSKLGIDPATRPADNENFLELVVKEFRNSARFR
jgi:uncharacterized RDD family membrane protein YckC